MEINDEVRDAVGEITNMISGVARKKLESQGYNILAAIPTVVSGKDHAILHVLGGPSIIIPFEMGERRLLRRCLPGRHEEGKVTVRMACV